MSRKWSQAGQEAEASRRRWLPGPGWSGAVPPRFWISGLILAAAVAASLWGWHRLGPSVAHHERYRIRPEHFQVTPPPPWVPPDLIVQVYRDASLAEASLLEEDLTVRVAQAFELHPWVRRVLWVTKRPGPLVRVQLEYRKPVLMVESPQGGYWPVDTEGVLLPPENFQPQDTRRFLRLRGLGKDPAGTVGTAYGERVVLKAAQLATLLQPLRQRVPLSEMRVKLLPFPGSNTPFPQFVLATADGLQLIWGSPPGDELPQEQRAEEKIGWLEDHADSLSHWVSNEGVLDLRQPQPSRP